jgi:hypothetical protein
VRLSSVVRNNSSEPVVAPSFAKCWKGVNERLIGEDKVLHLTVHLK